MFRYPTDYDVIVVGGGHAGIEAALASARTGSRTLMFTSNPDTIGQMSCNPAIGGLAKGHLVKEIDALGGEMGRATDMCGFQFKLLNSSKGPAVQSTRAQCDKHAYRTRMRQTCERSENLDVKMGQCNDLLLGGDKIKGIVSQLGVAYASKSVVLTTGTFLHGLMHVGTTQSPGGRAGESASFGISESLRRIGLEMGRLKTGTPPRLARRSVDFSKCVPQLGDEPPPFFSFWKDDMFHMEHLRKHPNTLDGEYSPYYPNSVLSELGCQIECHLTQTTQETARLIRSNLQKSPMYSGDIKSHGPRYCPSIEDKFVRFADKTIHQIFLEPEACSSDEVYVNGLSTCLPIDVQYELVRTVIGCESAEIVRPAYAIEYDYVIPSQLNHFLEAKTLSGLFLAGQINGTSGYEEAASQGIIAGINASRHARGLPLFSLRRDQAYIGVLIDDLVTREITEPYRVFTSRAEHRLQLREDNADLRLSEIGYSMGLVSAENYARFTKKKKAIDDELLRLCSTRINGITLEERLRRPEVSYAILPDARKDLSSDVIRTIEATIKYEGYIRRQSSEIARSLGFEGRLIPEDINYECVSSLKTEARLKLKKFRPQTVGQASRIAGVSPADISNLIIWMKTNHS